MLSSCLKWFGFGFLNNNLSHKGLCAVGFPPLTHIQWRLPSECDGFQRFHSSHTDSSCSCQNSLKNWGILQSKSRVVGWGTFAKTACLPTADKDNLPSAKGTNLLQSTGKFEQHWNLISIRNIWNDTKSYRERQLYHLRWKDRAIQYYWLNENDDRVTVMGQGILL